MDKPVVFLLLALAGFQAMALQEDRQQQLVVAADNADFKQLSHRGEFTGHVSLDQGTTHLRADKAATLGDSANQLIEATATGNLHEPAHYWTQPASDKPLVHAFADKICYYPKQHLIKLIGNARVIQGDNTFSAPTIIYDTLKQHVVSKSGHNARTQIVFQPEQLPGKKI